MKRVDFPLGQLNSKSSDNNDIPNTDEECLSFSSGDTEGPDEKKKQVR